MFYQFEYSDEAERFALLEAHADKYIVEERNITEGNFLVFTDVQPFHLEVKGRLESLEQEKMILQLALAETIEKQETDKVNNQVALAELVETLIIQGVL